MSLMRRGGTRQDAAGPGDAVGPPTGAPTAAGPGQGGAGPGGARQPAVVVEERVDMKRWDTAGFLTAAAAVALAVAGAVALARAGVDGTWYSPVVEVAGIDHTAALGAIEVGVAVVVLVPLLLGRRMIAALLAIAAGVVSAVAAIDPDDVSSDLAVERWWTTTLAAAGIGLGLLLIATRDRVKRIERHPVPVEPVTPVRQAGEAPPPGEVLRQPGDPT